jgi:SET domain-containing protein
VENVVVKKSKIQGKGVFAKRGFKKGETILAIDDSRVVTDDNPLRPELGEYECHCDYLAGGKVILMQPPERHINHCCEPNTYVKEINGVRHVVALKDVRSGEEITYDYCINGYGNTVWQCNCGSPKCRKTVHSDFFHLPKEKQLEYLPYLSDWFVDENREKIEELKREFRP